MSGPLVAKDATKTREELIHIVDSIVRLFFREGDIEWGEDRNIQGELRTQIEILREGVANMSR